MSPLRSTISLIAAALLGPPLIAITYLLVAAFVGLRHLDDPLPTLGYVVFTACLAAFVLVGARRAEGSAGKVTFATLAAGTSLCAMFVVFFAQMAA